MRESVVVLGMNVLPFARSAVNAGHDVTVVGLLTYRDLLSKSRYLSLARDFGNQGERTYCACTPATWTRNAGAISIFSCQKIP